MASNNQLTVQFKEATDYIKDVERMKHYDIANLLKIERPNYDQIRAGRRKPTRYEINILINKFPEVSRFFKKNTHIIKEPEQEKYTNESQLVKSLREIIKSKDKVIELLEAKVKDLEEDVNARREAHAETLSQLYTVEEAEALVKELKEKEKGE